MQDYKVEIYNLDLVANEIVLMDEIDTYEDLNFTDRLNDIGAASFKIDIYDQKASRDNLQRFSNVVAIKRNNVIVWAGPIVSITGQGQDINGKLTVNCASWLWYFKKRFSGSDDIYVDFEQGDIFWDLVDVSQNKTYGNLFITEGASITSDSINARFQNARLSEALQKLAGGTVNFDFNFSYIVDSDKRLTGVKLNRYYPRLGSVKSNIEKLTIGDHVKVINFTTKDSIENSGISYGAGIGTEPISSTVEVAGSQKGFTRLEVIQNDKAETIEEVLQDSLEAYLQKASREEIILDLQINPGSNITMSSFIVGDSLPLDVQWGNYLSVTGNKRVIERNIAIDNEGAETITPRFTYD